MTLYRLCAVTAVLALCSACEGGGLLADKPASPNLEPVPATGTAAATAKPDASLAETYWRLTELNGGPVDPGEGRELHMIVKGRDQVNGYAGCNSFTGSVTINGNTVAIGPVAATRRFCESVMEQENAFLLALESAATFHISGEAMAVSDSLGNVSMRFVAVALP